MQVGKFTYPSMGAFTSDRLSPRHIVVDSHTTSTHLTEDVRTSNTDPFKAGMTLLQGLTGDILCPVTAVLEFLAICPSSPGPLFLFKDDSALSCPSLVQVLHQALRTARVDDSQFSGQSFRIRVATTVVRVGLPDCCIHRQ